jgi:hypothetical protein
MEIFCKSCDALLLEGDVYLGESSSVGPNHVIQFTESIVPLSFLEDEEQLDLLHPLRYDIAICCSRACLLHYSSWFTQAYASGEISNLLRSAKEEQHVQHVPAIISDDRELSDADVELLAVPDHIIATDTPAMASSNVPMSHLASMHDEMMDFVSDLGYDDVLKSLFETGLP